MTVGNDYLSTPLSLPVDESLSSSSAASQASKSRTALGAQISPFLNYDPRFLQQAQPEFIFPEGNGKQRGRFELAFSQIGSSVMVGAAIGGVVGLYNGVRTTSVLQQTGKLRRTQMLNHIMKQGSGTANTLGVLAVMYSAFGVGLQFARGEDDDINTVLAGTATGLLYKSTSGLKKCGIGGGVGFGISGLYCLYNYMQKSGVMPNGF